MRALHSACSFVHQLVYYSVGIIGRVGDINNQNNENKFFLANSQICRTGVNSFPTLLARSKFLGKANQFNVPQLGTSDYKGLYTQNPLPGRRQLGINRYSSVRDSYVPTRGQVFHNSTHHLAGSTYHIGEVLMGKLLFNHEPILIPIGQF